MERTKAPIRVLDLPGIRQLEDRLLLEMWHDLDVDRVCHDLFGITPSGLFEMPDDFSELSICERNRIGEAYEEYEKSFETGGGLTDDEEVKLLRSWGLDFTDDRGQPLRCTKLLSRVAEAAAKGIKGKMPDHTAQWESALTRDREAFFAKKRKR
jgi:hypothetical protein